MHRFCAKETSAKLFHSCEKFELPASNWLVGLHRHADRGNSIINDLLWVNWRRCHKLLLCWSAESERLQLRRLFKRPSHASGSDVKLQPLSIKVPQALAIMPASDSLAILSNDGCVSILGSDGRGQELQLELRHQERITCIATHAASFTSHAELQGKCCLSCKSITLTPHLHMVLGQPSL